MPKIQHFAKRSRVGVLFAVRSTNQTAPRITETAQPLGIARFDMKYSAGTLSNENLMRCVEVCGNKVIPRVRELLG